MAPRLLAVLLAFAPAAQAETYKWVDERGVVNYSNSPPPAAAKAPQQIAERVSTYQTDPALRSVVARGVTPYEAMLHQEWMQRQRLIADSQNLDKVVAAAPAPEPLYYYPAVYSRGGAHSGHRRHNRRQHHPR